MASKAFLNQNPAVLKAVLTGTFPDGTGRTRTVEDRIAFEPYPHETYGVWILTQLKRWGLAPTDVLSSADDYARTVREVFDTTTAARVLSELGKQVEPRSTEIIMGRVFDPKNPTPWTQKRVTA
jgi:nitrate/nitrite transport system substrate-binding protein